MRYLKVMVFLSSLSFTLLAHSQQITVNDVKSIQQRAQSSEFVGRAEWNALTYYLQGVIEGSASYQAGLDKAEKRLLFCPPQDKQYSIEEFLAILKNSSGKDKDRPAALVIIESYTLKYPCQ